MSLYAPKDPTRLVSPAQFPLIEPCIANYSVKPSTTEANPRGIPAAPFVSSVTEFVSSRTDVESVLRNFQEMISKYQFMELNTQRRAKGLREKIPDIQKTLDTVRFLQGRKASGNTKPLETTFELNDTLYAKATIENENTDEVYLWLGANVMLAYPVAEAKDLLTEKLGAAELSLKYCEEDLEFLREQITVGCPARAKHWQLVALRGLIWLIFEDTDARSSDGASFQLGCGGETEGRRQRRETRKLRRRRKTINNISYISFHSCSHVVRSESVSY